MSATWFPRFAAIPGVTYQSPAGLDVSRLASRDTTPSIRFNEYTQSHYMSWPMAEGSTSSSPAGERAVGTTSDWTVSQILTNVAEALELPGEPSDYHFALQTAASALYGRRRTNPDVLDDVERLFLLDLDLLRAQPQVAEIDQAGERRFLTIAGLARLLRLYLTEGRVADAAALADIAERFGAGNMPDVAAARARAAALAAEDGS